VVRGLLAGALDVPHALASAAAAKATVTRWRRARTRPVLAQVVDMLDRVAPKPQIGEPAPDFELSGTGGPFRLSDHRGERVVLLFYPGDNTPVCTRQFCSYRDRADDFAALHATVVGISAQDIGSHEQFMAKNSLTVPLLADAGSEVAKAYGAHGRMGTKRAVIVVDEQGIVRYRHDHLLGLDYQSVDQLRAALDTLSPAPA
jgi:peroxiredoxin Q/BCP